MMLSASHPYPTTGTRTHSSAIFNRTHALSTERTSSASANQPTLSPPPQTILSTQRPRGSTLPSYSSGSASVVYTSISPERPIHNHEERPQLRKERASTLGSRSLQYQHNQYIEDDPNGHANVALPPIRVSDHEEDPREAYDRDERSKVRDDPPAKSSTYNLGHGGPRLPSIRTMLETRTLPTPNHMLSRGSRTPPPRSPISPQQHTRDYHSHGSVPTSSWNGRGHTVPTAGAGSSGSFHREYFNLLWSTITGTRIVAPLGSRSVNWHRTRADAATDSSPPPDDNSHAHRQVNHNGVGGVQTPMSSSSSVASSLSSQPVSLPPSSPQRDFRSRMSLASAGASILSLTAPFRHKRQQVSGATSPIRQYEPPPRGSFEDSEYSSTARSTPRHVSEELSGSLGRGYFGAQTIPSGVNQSLTSSHSNVSSSAGSFSVMSESDGGTFSNRSRVGETAGGKKRRSRATQEQLEILNAVYQRTPFPSTSERYDLSERLGMTQRSVQIW